MYYLDIHGQVRLIIVIVRVENYVLYNQGP